MFLEVIFLNVIQLMLVLCNDKMIIDRFGGACKTDSLAVYKITLDGYWSKELFPKHYPTVRPPASFSRTFGLSHTEKFSLFKIKETASTGLKEFCETTESHEWENEDLNDGVFDEFTIGKLSNPTDKMESRLFVNSNFSHISVVTKLIPSPDWFIGISSLQLCRDNKWVEKISLEVRPLDCGVSSGLTFSAPVWATNPQDPIQPITPHFPKHQASSFFYPEKENLPPIAYYHLEKVKEYVGVKEKSVKRIHQKFRRHDERQQYRSRRTNNKSNHLIKSIKRPDDNANTISDYESPDCIVSEWGIWSECTKECGIGEKFRNRTIIKDLKTGGNPCPQLTERSWCGSSKCQPSSNDDTDNSSYFKW